MNKMDGMNSREGAGGDGGARPRLLFADSSPRLRELCTAALTGEGYDVTPASDAGDVRRRLESGAFDLLLCDADLPGGGGTAMLAEIRAAFPDLPVVLMAVHGTVALAREALEGGASDFVSKPFGRGELPIVAERNLSRSAVQRRDALAHGAAVASSAESLLDALLTALNARDTEPPGHSERVTAYTMELANALGDFGRAPDAATRRRGGVVG